MEGLFSNLIRFGFGRDYLDSSGYISETAPTSLIAGYSLLFILLIGT